MGTRTNFYKIPKANLDKVKEELTKDKNYDVFDIIYDKEVREQYNVEELGLYETGTTEFLDLEYKEEFKKHCQLLVDDTGISLMVVGTEALKIWIEEMQKNIIEGLERTLAEKDKWNDQSKEKRMESYLKARLNFWKGGFNTDLDLNKKYCISRSWYRDYEIYDLVHLYKVFDFEKHCLIVTCG